MNDFTASNGAKVVLRDYRHFDAVSVSTVDKEYDLAGTHTQALREFFQAEADERLGRWRWPENPDYVVYPSALYLTPSNNDLAQVVNEANGQCHRVRRDDPNRLFGLFSEAGAAYFDAHPEPKPWHDAEDREIWAVQVACGSASETKPMQVVHDHGVTRFHPIASDLNAMVYGVRSSEIQGAHRIWPEVSS